MTARWLAVFLCVQIGLSCAPALAALPQTCEQLGPPPAGTESKPVAELRRQVEAVNETDPDLAIRLMCATVPRVERDYGRDSLETAWWVQSLATPLIAYKERFSEAVPLLERVRPILEKQLGRYAPEIAEIHVAYAWMNFRRGLLGETENEWQQALQIRERVPGLRKIELQKVLVGLAQAQLARRNFTGAQASLGRALGILEENGESVSEAAAAIENAYTNILVRQEKYAEARQHAETQIRIERRLAKQAQLVTAHALLGTILERLDEYEASEATLREAIRISESNEPLQKHLLVALTQLASLLNTRGKPEEALPFALRSLEVGETTLGPDAPALVRVLRGLADVHRSLGELPQALHLYERAGQIVEKQRAQIDPQVLVSYYAGYGALGLTLGDEAAPSILRAGLQAAGSDATLSIERATLLSELALATEQGDATASAAQLGEALRLYRARLPAGHPTILRVINALCGVELAADPRSVPHCTEALQALDSAREVEPSLRHAVYENQSLLAAALSQPDLANTYAVRALAAASALGTPDPLWRADFGVARSLASREQRPLAVFFGKQAIDQIERLRGNFTGDDRRLDPAFIRDKVDVYRTVADWLMEAGRVDEGLDVLRLLKNEELQDFTLRDGSRRPGARVELTNAEQSLSTQLAGAMTSDAVVGAEIDRLTRLKEAGRISTGENERLNALLIGQRTAEADRVERINRVIEGGLATSGAGVTERTVQAAQLDREARRFGPDTALAVYLLTDTHLRVLVASRAGQQDYEVPVDANELRRDIGRFLDAIVKREDVSVLSRSLYDTLAKPVDQAARKAGATHVVLWPDGALRYVPFAALHDGQRYLAEKYSIQIYASPGSSAARTPKVLRTSTTPSLNVRGLGVTRALSGFEPLPSVADELCYIVRGPIEGLAAPGATCPDEFTGRGALPGRAFADAAFTESRFTSLMEGPRDFSVLHLGTHFSLRPGNALRSFLLLGDGSRLTLDKIDARDFSGIELMTLSACQTGMGGAVTDDGREIEGLSTIVQRRGAQRVIASLWQVEDRSTARLMRYIYDALPGRGQDTARALQRAQLAVKSVVDHGRRPYEHPYYWAAFVLSGSEP